MFSSRAFLRGLDVSAFDDTLRRLASRFYGRAASFVKPPRTIIGGSLISGRNVLIIVFLLMAVKSV